jgi:hypothetical protein
MPNTSVNHTAVENSIIRRIKELREPYALNPSGGRSTSRMKTQAQFSRERAFIDGMCEGAFRFLGDMTPVATFLRLAEVAEA